MGLFRKNISLTADLEKVDQFIRDSLKSNQRILSDSVNDLLEAGGKRLRPAMVLMAGSFGKYDASKLIPLAASIEIMHMATLVHDDIIDEAELRRGRQTVQSRRGKEIAVFAGDFLFTRAFSVITQKTSDEIMRYLAKAIQAICEGEIDQFDSRFCEQVSLRRYLKRISRKTAMLFALSCVAGAYQSNCKPEVMRHLRLFGHEFGMAFQITDDLLDFSGVQAEVGKPLCSDFAEGVYTLPVIYTLLNDKHRGRIEPYIGKKELSEDDLNDIGRIVKESGGIDYSIRLAARYLDRCRMHLAALPNSPAKDALSDLLEETIVRRY